MGGSAWIDRGGGWREWRLERITFRCWSTRTWYLHKTSRATCKHQLEWPQGKQRASIRGTESSPRSGLGLFKVGPHPSGSQWFNRSVIESTHLRLPSIANCKSQNLFASHNMAHNCPSTDGWHGWLDGLGGDPFPFRPQSAERNQLERWSTAAVWCRRALKG